MEWVAISGSWRQSSPELENDVRSHVSGIMREGNGIVTGGALGVDYVATAEALLHDARAERIKIILPTTLDIYKKHFRARALEKVITQEAAEMLISQLEHVKEVAPSAIEEMDFTVCDPETYHARNGRVIELADALVAFHVNGTQGVQDAIDKASSRGLPVIHKKYEIE